MNITEKEKIISYLLPKVIDSDFVYSTDIQEFLLKFTEYIPLIKNKQLKKFVPHHLSLDWEEFPSNNKEKEVIDLWSFPKESDYKCTNKTSNGEQPLFYCYTCGIIKQFYCCLSCALTCHKGHDLVFVKYSSNKCDCYSIPNMCLHNPQQESLYSNETIRIRNAEGFLRNYFSFQNNMNQVRDNRLNSLSTIIRSEQNQIRVVGPFQEDNNTKQNSNNNYLKLYYKILQPFKDEKQIKKEKICFEKFINASIVQVPRNLIISSICDSLVFLHSSDLFFGSLDSVNLRKISNKSSYAPVILTTVCGTLNNILLISNSNSIVSYSLPTFTKLSSIEIQSPIIQLILHTENPNLIFGSSITNVTIFHVTDNGIITIKQQNFVNILPDDYIISIYTIPLNPNIIGILTQNNFQFFDINNIKNPILNITINDSQINFYSSEIVQQNKNVFIIITFTNGKYNIINYSLNKENTILINEFKEFPWKSFYPFLNYSQETNFLFITESSSDIILIECDKFIENKFNPIYIKTFNFPSDLCLCSTHPMNPFLFIFIHPISGGIITIEFNENKIKFSANDSLFETSRFPILPMDKTPISLFKYQNNLYVLTTDGRISEIKLKKSLKENVITQLKVPPTFWVYSNITMENVNVNINGLNGSFNSVLTRKPIIIPQRSKTKIIEIYSTANDSVIVGFRILISPQNVFNGPQQLQIFNRIIEVNCSRYVSIPLDLNEIGIGKRYQIKFNFQTMNDIIIDEINVFTIPISKLPSLDNEFDWFYNGESLFDFIEPNIEPKNELQKIAFRIANAFVDSENIIINENELIKICESLYTNEIFCNCSRIILNRMSTNKEIVVKCWGKAIENVLKNKLMNQNLWEYLLRDFYFLPYDKQQELKELLWDANPPKDNPFCLRLAFI